ncbi:hypothetical protein HHK36_022638 [Tetracentron sinense]|uniref:NB-ARC domain-containing protein n=1 Tax=Tetracentron sinense TaxID=13715 RepID=A0A835D700_TETSI|nr:hypothetical protein HHK36_022638 [Tetracentron sinense]
MADILPLAVVEAMSISPIVGMNLLFENIWRCLKEEDQVGIIGIYEANVTKIQKDIEDRVWLSFQEDVSQASCAAHIFNALNNKKYVLLLDDIWDRVDFEAIGIPFPNSENKSKVIFTTRSEALCGRMEAHRKIRVEETLNSHPDIPKLAESVAKECSGLPLAINTIEFLGMEDEVLHLLKFSYDSLPKGEGFIVEYNDMNEAFNQGHHIIGMLKSMCLLESSYDEEFHVKMHDVICDLALWIASECGRNKDKLLVKANLQLIQAPEVEKWEKAKRISLADKDISVVVGNDPGRRGLGDDDNLRQSDLHDYRFDRFGDSKVEGWGGASLGEFEFVKHLKAIGINLRISDLQRLLNSKKLLRCTNDLFISECPGLISFPLSPLCLDLKELAVSWVVEGEEENGFSSTLVELTFIHLPNLKIVRAVTHQSFQNLTIMFIQYCDALKNHTWRLGVESLRFLHIANCKGIEEVICGGVEAVEEESTTFSRL